MGTRLYVGNIPYNTTDADLRTLFGQNGRLVSEVKIVTDRETGQSRGFAFVEMAKPDEAQAAITELNGASMGGRSIVVNEARERTPGGAGGPRGYAGGGGSGGPRGPGGGGGYAGGGGAPGGGGGGYAGGGRPGGFNAGGPRGPGGPRPGGFGGPRPGGGFGGRGAPAPEKDQGRRRQFEKDKKRARRDEDGDY